MAWAPLAYRGSDSESSFLLHDWMRKVRSPTPYRVAGSSVHVNIQRLVQMAVVAFVILIVTLYIIPLFFHSGDFHSRA